MKGVLHFSLPLTIILFPIVFLSCFITPKPIHARSIKLSWAANTEQDLLGYKIYRKIHTDPTDPNVDYVLIHDKCLADPNDFEDPNNPTYEDPNLDDITIYYYVVTAYDTSGLESDYSNEVHTDMNIVVNTYYLDADGDGYGDAQHTAQA